MYSVAIDEGVWMASYTSCAAQTAPIHYTIGSGGVGGPAGPALAVVMNINIELLMGATGPPHFTSPRFYYVCMRSANPIATVQVKLYNLCTT